MSLVILSAIVFISAVFLAWRVTKNILSPVFISMGIFFLFYVGGVVYFIIDDHSLTPFYFSIGALFYGLGAFITAGFFRFKPDTELKNFKQKSFFNIFPSKRLFFISLTLVFIISIILTFYYFYCVGIPLFQSSEATVIARKGKGMFFRVFITFLPLILLITYLFQKTTKKFSVKLFWWIVIATCLVCIVLYGSRGIALKFLIPFILTYSLFRVKHDLRKIAIVLLLFVLVAVAFQYSYPEYRKLSLPDAFTLFFNRMTVSQAEALDHMIYNLVPEKRFLMGERTMQDFRGILATLRIVPYSETFGEWLYRDIHPDYKGEAGFTIVTTTMGDLYIDWGIVGVILGMFVYGFLAQGLYIKSIRGTKDCFLLAVYSYLQYILIVAHIGGGFLGCIANYGISLIIFIFMVMGINIFLLFPIHGISLRFPQKLSLIH